jgi:hypothetical protein
MSQNDIKIIANFMKRQNSNNEDTIESVEIDMENSLENIKVNFSS